MTQKRPAPQLLDAQAAQVVVLRHGGVSAKNRNPRQWRSIQDKIPLGAHPARQLVIDRETAQARSSAGIPLNWKVEASSNGGNLGHTATTIKQTYCSVHSNCCDTDNEA